MTKITIESELIEPFIALAEELLSVSGRASQPNRIPVFACNKAEITIGDCRRLLNNYKNKREA